MANLEVLLRDTSLQSQDPCDDVIEVASDRQAETNDVAITKPSDQEFL
jgi:hypothetical protein